MRTQVGIIGGGPAGLVLGRMLALAGIDSVILEKRDREYVESRMRAGLLEHPVAELLCDIGLGVNLRRSGAQHAGFEVRFWGEGYRFPVAPLTGGRANVLYPQQAIVKDAIEQRLAESRPLLFEAEVLGIEDLRTRQPTIRFRAGGKIRGLSCDFVIGCDGHHGVSRRSIPQSERIEWTHTYPFAWLGVLAAAPPRSAELVYATHPSGFALHSMRQPDRSRLYLQIAAGDRLDHWPDERIWRELDARLSLAGERPLEQGPILERSITALRSFVCMPMSYYRLFLAGDAAHIVPPSAAKGLNLAIHDAYVLAEVLERWYLRHRVDALASYAAAAERRVWWAQQFSGAMTTLLHHAPGDRFDAEIKRARLERLAASEAAMRAFCEEYVGPPFDGAQTTAPGSLDREAWQDAAASAFSVLR